MSIWKNLNNISALENHQDNLLIKMALPPR